MLAEGCVNFNATRDRPEKRSAAVHISMPRTSFHERT